MAAQFELWDGESGNALGDYTTEEEAHAVIRETIQHDGRPAVATFALLRVDGRGRAKTIAEGNTLADRSLSTERSAPAPVGASRRESPSLPRQRLRTR